MPHATPELVNSVICCGRSAPWTFVSRWYQPQPGASAKPFMKPAMFVDSARSAEHASTSGRPIVSFDSSLTHAPRADCTRIIPMHKPPRVWTHRKMSVAVCDLAGKTPEKSTCGTTRFQ